MIRMKNKTIKMKKKTINSKWMRLQLKMKKIITEKYISKLKFVNNNQILQIDAKF